MAKVKIFLFFVFIVVTIVFVTQISRFLDLGFSTINSKKQVFKCSKSDFKVSNFIQTEDKVIIEITSYDSSISKVTIVGNETYVKEYEPMLEKGTNDNIMLNSSLLNYYIFIDECEQYGYEIKNGVIER